MYDRNNPLPLEAYEPVLEKVAGPRWAKMLASRAAPVGRPAMQKAQRLGEVSGRWGRTALRAGRPGAQGTKTGGQH